MRSDIDSAVAAGAPSLGGLAGVSTRPGLNTPTSPHQTETPRLSQHPPSPFALHSGAEHVVASACLATAQGASLDAAHDFADTNQTSYDHHAVPANTSVPTSPFGTPRGGPRHASFSHHVPPIAATVSAAAAALGLNASSRPSHYQDGSGADQGVHEQPGHWGAEEPRAERPTLDAAPNSPGPGKPSSGPKQDNPLAIPPPPLQPMHQSASAAELAAQVKEAESQASSEDEAESLSGVSAQPAHQPAARQQEISSSFAAAPATAPGAKSQQASKLSTSQPFAVAPPKQQQQQPQPQQQSQQQQPQQQQQQQAPVKVEQPGKAPSVKEGGRAQKESKQEKAGKQEDGQAKKDAGQAARGGAGVGDGDEKPKTTRAERRAKQEAERAAKEAGVPKGGGKQSGTKHSQAGSSTDKGQPAGASAAAGQSQAPAPLQQPAASRAKPAKQAAKATADGPVTSLPSDVFAHLPKYKRTTLDSVLAKYNMDFPFHPAVLKLGLKYADGTIKGANARCIAMLDMLREMVEDYSTPSGMQNPLTTKLPLHLTITKVWFGKVLSRDLTQQLNSAIQFLVQCRPLSISMGNAIKFLKLQVSKIDPAAHESDAKQELVDKINTYIQEKIVFADNVLVTNAVAKVYTDDVILTYGFSSVVFNVLLRAKKEGKKFRVVVMDSRPQLEGRPLLRRLLSHGIACSYVLLNAASYIMSEVTKVFLGASAVLSNGTVMSRAGSSAVAMMATAFSKPVIICCETYKFHEKVQLDSITANELGDPSVLEKVARRSDITALQDWQQLPRLDLLNLTYDAMPQDFVTLVVTEFGAIPPTSVPVILREYRQEPTI
ncbi:hypothetical protein ABBQ38_002372 [Trebouxia sp. C0009 RCD-2024]